MLEQAELTSSNALVSKQSSADAKKSIQGKREIKN